MITGIVVAFAATAITVALIVRLHELDDGGPASATLDDVSAGGVGEP